MGYKKDLCAIQLQEINPTLKRTTITIIVTAILFLVHSVVGVWNGFKAINNKIIYRGISTEKNRKHSINDMKPNNYWPWLVSMVRLIEWNGYNQPLRPGQGGVYWQTYFWFLYDGNTTRIADEWEMARLHRRFKRKRGIIISPFFLVAFQCARIKHVEPQIINP